MSTTQHLLANNSLFSSRSVKLPTVESASEHILKQMKETFHTAYGDIFPDALTTYKNPDNNRPFIAESVLYRAQAKSHIYNEVIKTLSKEMKNYQSTTSPDFYQQLVETLAEKIETNPSVLFTRLRAWGIEKELMHKRDNNHNRQILAIG